MNKAKLIITASVLIYSCIYRFGHYIIYIIVDTNLERLDVGWMNFFEPQTLSCKYVYNFKPIKYSLVIISNVDKTWLYVINRNY